MICFPRCRAGERPGLKPRVAARRRLCHHCPSNYRSQGPMRKFLLLPSSWLIFLALAGFALICCSTTARWWPRSARPTPQDVGTTQARWLQRIREATAEDAAGRNSGPHLHRSDANSGPEARRPGAARLPCPCLAERQGRVEGEASVPAAPALGTEMAECRGHRPPVRGTSSGSMRCGSVAGSSCPTGPSIAAGRIGANLVIGGKAGDKILSAASAMEIEGRETWSSSWRSTRDSRGEVMKGVFGTLRGGDMPTGEEIDAMYVAIRDAIEDGTAAGRRLLPAASAIHLGPRTSKARAGAASNSATPPPSSRCPRPAAPGATRW